MTVDERFKIYLYIVTEDDPIRVESAL